MKKFIVIYQLITGISKSLAVEAEDKNGAKQAVINHEKTDDTIHFIDVQDDTDGDQTAKSFLWIDKEIHNLAARAANWTTIIEKELTSGIAIDFAAIIPEGEQEREAILAICETAGKSLNAVVSLTDSAGTKGLLQRLGCDITALLHGKKKSFADYCITFEKVFNDLFGGASASA